MNGQIGFFVGALLMPVLLVPGIQQPPPPPGLLKPSGRLAEILRQTATAKAVDKTAQRALAYSRAFAECGEKRLQSGQFFAADRMAEAADAMLHVAEHQQHLRTRDEPKGPPPPMIQDQLQRAYFRIQQADYFLIQAHDARAAAFPKWSRDFYQLAVRAYERHDLPAADENAKSAEDIVRALENLAQAAASPLGGGSKEPL